MNGFDPVRECVFQYTDAGQSHVDYDTTIVRCRNCKHFTASKEFWGEVPAFPVPLLMATADACDYWAGTECKVEPDGFCAWGERRASE